MCIRFDDESLHGVANFDTMFYFWAVIWVDSEQKEHHLIASINQAKDWETEDVFTFDFDGKTVDAASSVSAKLLIAYLIEARWKARALRFSLASTLPSSNALPLFAKRALSISKVCEV